MESLDERHREEVRRRRVVVQEREDGMSDLWAYLPTVEAYAIHDRLTRIARDVERAETAAEGASAGDAAAADVPGSTGASDGGVGGAGGAGVRRVRDEIRADVFTELLLGADPSAVACSSGEGVHARVQVIVPVTALDPETGDGTAERGVVPVAELSGAGPIAVSAARSLAAASR
ncbi:DUF222 domain-containing protein, partial [Leucobacter sp. USCH14]|uniref:DUF222 domain-containing protein n=1 Tax=Leucobacter sp. USCH14 TaxID=3024838 RepID=UPI0030A538B1